MTGEGTGKAPADAPGAVVGWQVGVDLVTMPNGSPEGWQAADGAQELAALMARQAADLEVADPAGVRVSQERDALLPVLEGHLEGLLDRCGMQVRERAARLDLVPDAIAQAIQGVAPFGVDPGGNGFGLSGGAGVGKTMAVAALVKRYGHRRLVESVTTLGRDGLRDNRWLCWLSWPDQVHRMRTASLADGGHAVVAGWVDRWSTVSVLVLDDLGVERVVGASYADDWATSNLDRVLDARERSAMPTWYTTNLDAAALVERYGGRMFSRLAGGNRNPLLRVDRAADMRMARRAGR